MAANNSTASIALNQEQAAAFGVVLNADGSLQTLKAGQFDAGQADDIARNLILLASSIRCAARSAIFSRQG
ncbi:MAG: hypothetical protein E6R09_02735 [Rhodocyclaceae bacterium]|nr:MAG: hypothetical protein E6R09_02735 [Rhodocyclaceae bacterium]